MFVRLKYLFIIPFVALGIFSFSNSTFATSNTVTWIGADPIVTDQNQVALGDYTGAYWHCNTTNSEYVWWQLPSGTWDHGARCNQYNIFLDTSLSGTVHFKVCEGQFSQTLCGAVTDVGITNITVCDINHLNLCVTQQTCETVPAYWINSSCLATCQTDKVQCRTQGECETYSGYWYNSQCNLNPTVTCGNGILEGDEECDDGDTSSGDGCSNICAVEVGWSCIGEPSVCSEEHIVVLPVISGGQTTTLLASLTTATQGILDFFVSGAVLWLTLAGALILIYVTKKVITLQKKESLTNPPVTREQKRAMQAFTRRQEGLRKLRQKY